MHLQAINELYVDGEQYEELRQSIEETAGFRRFRNVQCRFGGKQHAETN